MSAKPTENVGNKFKAAFSESVGNSDCYNDRSDYSNRAEEFFQKLSRDTLLHKKLNSVSWLEEGEWRGFAILSRTLYLMTLGIKNERDEARALSAKLAEQLSNTMEVVCDICKKHTSRLNFPAIKEKKKNLRGERSGRIESNPSISSRNKCQKHIHDLHNDREALTELDNILKPKKICSPYNDSNGNLSAHSAIPANSVVLAPDTQMLVVSEQVPMPIDGHTSVPETLLLDASQPEDLVANEDSFNDSRDVFENSDCENTENVPELSNNDPDTRVFVKSENECTETITATHVSPVLGKAFGNKSSQSSGNSDLSPNRCRVVVRELKPSRLSSKIDVLCKMQDKYLNDTTDSPISRIVNITRSPKCHSDTDVASPQLLNLVPHRSTTTISQPVGSQVSTNDLKNRLAKEYSSNVNIVCVNLASSHENASNNNGQDKIPKDNDNLTEKLRSCRKISFIADDTKSSNEAKPENMKFLHESPPLNSNLKLESISDKNSKKGPLDKISAKSKNSVISKDNDNLAEQLRSCGKICFIAHDTKSFSNEGKPEHSKGIHESSPLNSNLELESISDKNLKKSPLHKIYANNKNKLIKYDSEINNTLEEPVSETVTTTRTSRLSIGGHKCNMVRDNKRSISMHANVIPEKMQTRDTKSVISEATSVNFSMLKKSNKNSVFMSKPEKKNYKQTKLTSESFIVSKIKGNIESDDPMVEVAKMKSLESKVIDDRRRLQLQHPALHQLHQQQLQQHEQSSDLSAGKSLQNKEPFEGSSSRRHSDETCDHSKYYDGKVGCLELQTGAKEDNKTVADHSKDVSSPKTKRKSNEACLHEDASSHMVKSKRVRPCSSSESVLSETQMMRAINDTTSSSALTNDVLVDATSVDSNIKKDIALKEDAKTTVIGATSKTAADILPTTELNRMERRVFYTKEINYHFIRKRATSSNVKNGESTSKKPLKSNLNKEKDHVNDSFDRVPRVHCSPKYAHAAPVERGRAKRWQLPGWSCQQCRLYYEGRDMTEEQKKEAMNRCSKHRSKHKPITNTPTNYWKVDLSSSDSD